MRTKLCVLGAVLGTIPGLLPLVPRVCTGGEEALPGEQVPADVEHDVPTHPCELVTVMKVPCDPASATCEYTYWECPRKVKPLRA
jgi:hypothetical protein